MDQTLQEFNILYPVYKTKSFSTTCSICEPANAHVNRNKDFLCLDIQGCNGEQFPFAFAGDSIAFYQAATSQAPMLFNCDGIFFTNYKDRNLLFLCELKSSFDTLQLLHAKEQIVGTALRLHAQLSVLQTKPNWEIHGVIASYEPSTEKLAGIKDLTSYDAKFSRSIYVTKHKDLGKSLCDQFYKPLSVPQMRIHYVGVPQKQQRYQISIDELLAL